MGISKNELYFITYPDQVGPPTVKAMRTYLLVTHSKTQAFGTFVVAQTSFASNISSASDLIKRFADGIVAKPFAIKLHGYAHFNSDSMIKLSQRDGVLTPILKQSLISAYVIVPYASQMDVRAVLRSFFWRECCQFQLSCSNRLLLSG